MDPATAIRSRFPSYSTAQTPVALSTTNDVVAPAWFPAGQTPVPTHSASAGPSMMQYAVAAAVGIGAGYLAAKYMKKGKRGKSSKRSKR